MWTNLKVKNYRGPSLRGSPKFLEVLPSRTWAGSHSKPWRKTPLGFLQGRGKRNHFELCQRTAVLNKADQEIGYRGNLLTRAKAWGLIRSLTGLGEGVYSTPSHPVPPKRGEKYLWSSKSRHTGSPRDWVLKTRQDYRTLHLFPHLTAILPKADLQKFLLTGTSGPVIKKKTARHTKKEKKKHTLSLKRQIKRVKHKTMKILEDNIGENLDDFG